MSDTSTKAEAKHFIEEAVRDDFAAGRYSGAPLTRFPPEPNGYLHIGHAKSICLNFSLAKKHNGACNLRFDDTNPIKEEQHYIDAIKEDVRWLGFAWDNEFYASDYFEKLYEYAQQLIRLGKAYVCDLTPEQIRAYRGTLTEPGRESPHRNRSVEENLDLFARMRKGEFKDGERVLRAKIDMASGNLNLRDPVMYRILHAHHPRMGDKWCIYPTYDWAHGQSDSIEKITHSICTLEFADHRPLYDWFIEQLNIHHPRQIEFARLNLSHTMMSKRKLLALVAQDIVDGWDDPRMPTLAGLRRRGYTPESIRDFCEQIGVTKSNSIVDFNFLEYCLRQHLNDIAPRVMGVLRPLKVTITNYPQDKEEMLPCANHPQNEAMGTREVPFSSTLYIERDDFMEDAPKKFFRLAPGREVRLRYAYFIKCEEVIKNDAGEAIELRCTYDPATRGGNAPDGRKVKGTIHWVSAAHAVEAEARLYDHLFKEEDTDVGEDLAAAINPNSLQVVKKFYVEPSLKEARHGASYQFERLAYFCLDQGSTKGKLIFNRSVSLKDAWSKMQQQKK